MDGTVIDADLPLLNDEASDSESITYVPIADDFSEDRALLHLVENSDEYINLKHHFLQSVGSLAEGCSVLAIRRMVHCTSANGRARLEAFRLYVKAAAGKNGGREERRRSQHEAGLVRRPLMGFVGLGAMGLDLMEYQWGVWFRFLCLCGVLSKKMHSKPKEPAMQRAIQLQKEEEQRAMEQKAKALAKLNNRTSGKDERDTASGKDAEANNILIEDPCGGLSCDFEVQK